MKIAAIEAIPYSIPYLHPLHFASGSVHEADHVLIRLRTDDGVVGIADTPPRPYTYGETQKSIVAVVEDIFAPQLIGVDIFDREKVQEILYRTVHNQTAKGAVDIALWDVIGKTLGQPVTKLLGGYTDSLRVSHMLGFKPAQELLASGAGVPRDLRHQHVQAQDRPAPPSPGHRGRPGAARRPGRGRRAVHGRQPRAGPPTRPPRCCAARRTWACSSSRSPTTPAKSWAAAASWPTPPSPSPRTNPPPTSVRPHGKSSPAAPTSWRSRRPGPALPRRPKSLGWPRAWASTSTSATRSTPRSGTAASVVFGAAFAHTAKRAAELSNYLDMADDLLAEPLAITGGRIRVPEGPGVGTAVDEDKLARYRTDR